MSKGRSVHKSRLATIVIDCNAPDVDTAAEFWSRALGLKAKRSPNPADANYCKLETLPSEPTMFVQAVSHPSRVHIDIETNDIEAEVARLEKLGARRVQQVKRWWVMEAPTGQRFCVVNPQRADFEAAANVWND